MSAATTSSTRVEDLERVWNDDAGDAHATPDCREAGPGGWVEKASAGWLCSHCIDVDVRRVLPHDAPSVDAPDRGDGTGSTSAPRSDLPSEKQLAFLLRLVGEKLDVEDPQAWLAALVAAGLNKRAASKTIDEMLKLPTLVRDADPDADPVYRWTKRAEVWLVRGPAVEVGAIVPVTKAGGQTSQAEIVEVVEAGLYRVERVDAPPAPGESGSLRATMLRLRDRIVEDTGKQTRDRSIRVCVPASVLGVDDQPDAAYRIGWGYDSKGADRHVGGPGEIREISLSSDSAVKLAEFLLAATPEELTGFQTAYGQHFHECGRCGSPLSDKDSKARGLGPDCARLV